MRAVQIERIGGPEDGEQLFDISSGGVNSADTHHRLSCESAERSLPLSA